MRLKFNLLAISDRRSLNIDFVDWLRILGEVGVGAVQIREKDLDDGDLYRLTRLARETLPATTKVIVNGRIDVAVAADADGVHLPADGLPAIPLRARFGPRMLIGRSVHSLAEARRARHEDVVDYLTLGPIYETPGKGPPLGLKPLTRAVRLGVPVFALGGVTIGELGQLASAGASGVAGIRMFQYTRNLDLVVRVADFFFTSEARRADCGNR